MNFKEILKNVKSAESTISMILGILVVVVLGILFVKYFRGILQKESQGKITVESASSEAKPTEKKIESPEAGVIPKDLPAEYEVKSGDTLWKISKNFYGTGYNWVNISQENNLKNPGKIFVGQKLSIPKVSPKIVIASQNSLPKTGEETIIGEKYTVVKGDSLWKISVRAYQDGFKWLKIAQANHLTNPKQIHPGNVLVIPR
jgi:nucleoid-associated protein YgaU